MLTYDDHLELAPRDIVARSIHDQVSFTASNMAVILWTWEVACSLHNGNKICLPQTLRSICALK